jgi:hypothetical protein
MLPKVSKRHETLIAPMIQATRLKKCCDLVVVSSAFLFSGFILTCVPYCAHHQVRIPPVTRRIATHLRLLRLCVAVFGVGFNRVRGFRRRVQQFYALLIKHMIHSRRNVILTVVQLLLPVIFTIFACILEKVIVGPTDAPALPLNLSYFNGPIIPISSNNATRLNAASLNLTNLYQNEADYWGTVRNTNQDMDLYLLGVAYERLDVYNRNYLIASTLALCVLVALLLLFG